MTPACWVILLDVTENGPQDFNGLKEKPIKFMKALGFVTYTYDFLPAAIGRGRRRFRVTATEQGHAYAKLYKAEMAVNT